MTEPAVPPPSQWSAPWTAPQQESVPPGTLLAPPAPELVSPTTERSTQLRAAALLIAALAVVGAVIGVIWQAWSPAGPAGVRLAGSVQADETESFVAGDGRFVLMTSIAGLLAALATWYLPRLRAARGPYVALGLGVGGIVGSAVAELVGWLIRGQGSDYRCGDGSLTCVDHIPLTVHMHALLLFESVVALLVYILFVAFAVADDLGRPDPLGRRDEIPPPPEPYTTHGSVATQGSVGTQGYLQHPGPDGDGAGPPQ